MGFATSGKNMLIPPLHQAPRMQKASCPSFNLFNRVQTILLLFWIFNPEPNARGLQPPTPYEHHAHSRIHTSWLPPIPAKSGDSPGTKTIIQPSSNQYVHQVGFIITSGGALQHLARTC